MIETINPSQEAKKIWDFRPGEDLRNLEDFNLQRRAKLIWDFRREEFSHYFTNITTPFPKGKIRVLLFGQGRSGSTLLESLICSTPYFQMHGELLSPYCQTMSRHGVRIHQGEPLFPCAYINGFLKQKPSKNFIFHLKLYHLTEERKRPVDPASVIRRFYNQGWKIIFLQRQNRIKHVLSDFLRDHRGRSHKHDNVKENHHLTIDCDVFVEMVKGRIRFGEMEEQVLQGLDFHPVIYDEDLENSSNHQPTLDKIFQFLDLEPRPISTTFKKVNTQSMEDLIANYGEFKQAILKNGWGHFLDESTAAS